MEDKREFVKEPEKPKDTIPMFCEVKDTEKGIWILSDRSGLLPGSTVCLVGPRLTEARKLGAVKVLGTTR